MSAACQAVPGEFEFSSCAPACVMVSSVWFGMPRFGAAWFGMVGYGMVGYGMAIAELIDTEYGQMIVPAHDQNQTGALRRTRRGYAHDTVVFMANLIEKMPPGRVMVDAGANIGVFTMGLAPCFEGGWIHAFEPQPILCNMLAGTVALSQRQNIRVHNVCLGRDDSWIEVPRFNYAQTLNFGSIEFGKKQIEQLSQSRGESIESVELRTLDSYDLERLDFIKIDVQRMEIELLAGARETLLRCKPLMLIEWVDFKDDSLRKALEWHRYEIVQAVAADDWLCKPIGV